MSSHDEPGERPSTTHGSRTSGTGRYSHLAADGEPEPGSGFGDQLDLVVGEYRITIFPSDVAGGGGAEAVLDGREGDGVVDVAEGVEVGLPQRPRPPARAF